MRERRRKKFSRGYRSNFAIGKTSIIVIGILIFATMLVLLRVQENGMDVRQAGLDELKSQKIELEEERDRLKIEATRLQSIKEIENSLNSDKSTDKYVPVDKINYLPTTNVAVK